MGGNGKTVDFVQAALSLISATQFSGVTGGCLAVQKRGGGGGGGGGGGSGENGHKYLLIQYIGKIGPSLSYRLWEHLQRTTQKRKDW